MKNSIRFGAAVAIALGLSAPAYAQSETASAEARAEILSALTLVKVPGSDLDFGNIVVDGTPTALAPFYATLDPSDFSVSCVANELICSGLTRAAQFEANGQANKTVRVNLPASATLNHATAADTLTVDTFTIDGSSAGSANLQEFVLDANGMITVDVLGNPVTQDVLDGLGNPISVTTVGLDGVGEAFFSVGGRLVVDGAKTAGVYSASFDVSVEYN